LKEIDVAVIGAGQGGLAASYWLKRSGIEHIVFEKGKIGETWRSQRWDSFALNTPNWSNNLDGLEFDPETPDGFPVRDEVIVYLEQYARKFDLPIKTSTPVCKFQRQSDGTFELEVEGERMHAKAAILATGGLSRPKEPALSSQLAANINSLTAGAYRNAHQLPSGGVLVVGSAQTGCQIAEDLLQAGRDVFLSTSRVGRVPRAYRGRDFMTWWDDMGLWDKRVDALEDPNLPFLPHPQVSGNDGGHTLSLQLLAQMGAVLLGGVENIDRTKLRITSNALENINFADERSETYKRDIDQFIREQNINAPPAEADPGERPMPDLNGSDRIRELDLEDHGVTSLIWCTGFGADWSILPGELLGGDGQPPHKYGVANCEGLYMIGMPWLRTRKSGILYGVSEDACHIVEHLENNILCK